MRVLRGTWREWNPPDGRSSLTIGVLDGVHKGHRALIGRLDDGLMKTVLTFEPHPVEVLQPGTPPRLITNIDERLGLLDDAGVHQVGVLDLTEIKDLSPTQFVQSLLVDKLRVSNLVVGPDFRFGKDRTGNIALLIDLGRTAGFGVDVIDQVDDGEGPVSSSRIRQMIETGRLEEAYQAMGSRYRVTNTVIDGVGRGREIGFPTANLRPPERKVVPAIGVYAAYARAQGQILPAAVNVGVRPTFGGGELLIEAHLIDFDADIYGQDVTVEFVEYLRPELKFDAVDELVTTIDNDVAKTRTVLAATAPDMS